MTMKLLKNLGVFLLVAVPLMFAGQYFFGINPTSGEVALIMFAYIFGNIVADAAVPLDRNN